MSVRARSRLEQPESLGDVLQFIKRNPDAEIWAGGTWWMFKRRYGGDRAATQRTIVALNHVRELRRVVRSDIHVEVGAAVPIGRLREVGHRLLPPIALEALDRVGPPAVRSLATLGGALCMPDTVLPVVLALQLLDARVELRRQGGTRWMTLTQFRESDGGIRLQRDELLTRIRIPTRSWTDWSLATFGEPFLAPRESLTIGATTAIEKSGIGEFRFAVLVGGQHQIRLRDAEADLVGRSTPLSEREQRFVLALLQNSEAFGAELDDLGRWRTANALRDVLRRLK